MLLFVERLGIKAIRFREKIEEKITKINRGHPNFKELCEQLISALKKEEVALQLYDELQILIDTGEKHPHWLELLEFERFQRSEIAA